MRRRSWSQRHRSIILHSITHHFCRDALKVWTRKEEKNFLSGERGSLDDLQLVNIWLLCCNVVFIALKGLLWDPTWTRDWVFLLFLFDFNSTRETGACVNTPCPYLWVPALPQDTVSGLNERTNHLKHTRTVAITRRAETVWYSKWPTEGSVVLRFWAAQKAADKLLSRMQL